MDLHRPFCSGFWKFTVPVAYCAARRMAWRRCLFLGEMVSETRREVREWAGRWARQGRAARIMAGRELWRGLCVGALAARRFGAGLRPPERWQFPLTLFVYLFVVFALEVAFLQTFLPDEGGGARRAALSAAVDGADRTQVLDPELAEEYRDLAEAYLPALHPRSPLPGQYLVRLEAPGAEPVVFTGEDDVALLADAVRHPLLGLPVAARPVPQPGPEDFDSVRRAVAKNEVRMPVDHGAFHPQDKEAILAAASRPGRLSRVFAAVPLSGGERALAQADLPSSAIAPPLTRLDKIRQAAARRADLGSLSALFESGVRGVFAIGYDAKGGTSYGKYQISSRMGAIRNFIKYLDKRAPSWAQRLRSAGTADTGGTSGSMPREWQHIAAEHPRLFEKLQDDFVHSHYYSPTIQAVREQTGLDLDAHGAVIREVLWSTAVHHGPSGGANIFIAASRRAQAHGGDFNRNLLQEVYREREMRLSRLPLSQQTAIRARLDQEMTMALARLKQDHPARTSVAQGAGGLM